MLYYEKQRGDLCRIHALNAYFGYNKIDEKTFNDYCNEYDKLIKGLNSRNMDGFAEGRNIISYILDKLDNKYCVYIPIYVSNNSYKYVDINRYKKKIFEKKIKFYFEFNKNHVWLVRYYQNQYYKLDSITGINIIDPNIIKQHGYLIVINDIHEEIIYNLEKLYSLKNELINLNSNIYKLIKNEKYFIYEILFYNLLYSLKTLKITKPNYIYIMKLLFMYLKLIRMNEYEKLKDFLSNITNFLI